jgi:hypothetical protein
MSIESDLVVASQAARPGRRQLLTPRGPRIAARICIFLLSVCGLAVAVLPSAAYASDQLQVSIQTTTPEQDVPVSIAFSGTAAANPDGGNTDLAAVVRPAGGTGCQSTPAADYTAAGNESTSIFNGEEIAYTDYETTAVGPGSFNVTGTFTPPNQGSYLLCAWITDAFDGSSATAQQSATFSARGPQVEQLTVSLPSQILPNVAFQVGFTTQTDQQLSLYAILKPAGGLPCASSYELESQQNEPGDNLFDGGTSVYGGPTTTNATVTEKKGSYVICSWIEGPTAQEVDANQSTTLTVEKPPPPPPCVVPKLGRDTPLAAAQADIAAAHCTPGTTTQRHSGSVPAGDVIKLRPGPKSKLKSGAKVALVVSTGPRRHAHRHHQSSARVAAALPTTVDLNGVLGGAPPDALPGAYGVQHPRHMDFGPIPIGYTLSARGMDWTGWGSPTAIGTGDVEYCPNMEPCTSGAWLRSEGQLTRRRPKRRRVNTSATHGRSSISCMRAA